MFFNQYTVIGALVLALIFPLVIAYPGAYWSSVGTIFVISIALQACFNIGMIGLQLLFKK